MLGHLRFRLRQVDHLPPAHPDLGSLGQAGPAPRAHLRPVYHHVRIRHPLQGDTVLAVRPSGTPTRPARNDVGAGLASPSDDGGLDEFNDDSFNRASRSAIRARACSNPAASSALRATSSSYHGSDDSADTTRQLPASTTDTGAA
jgi:hypothetical protein